ncbi:MarR family winged helix-turn-helix transcriptional regulator [Streptomyces johnsoniae]|uniref:MarR family transcriptional regulator n=1 Tax=Streptomyces johnsoniae TaxID=3075532 RepID=A0ABU2S254_9ACTN|nr:MarR family transcriptional regulator [Streptomyces sp. DSM 41886]MDT0442519.1 MarR family transcriptional regulator [Streptomyces sp. DSM 41886]
MHESRRTANLLGATALTVADTALAGAARAAGISPSGAAALVVLSTFPGLGSTGLGRHIGLTQSAAARLIDSLAADGLVRRRKGAGRSVPVTLTAEGTRAARALLDARAELLTDLVAVLEPAERAELTRLLGKLLTRLHDRVGDADLMCRMCDRGACTHGAACPVGRAARAAPDAGSG